MHVAVDARQPLHVAMRAGTVMSIFGTATGRAFAGVLGRERVAAAMAAAALGDPASGRARAVRAELDAPLALARGELASHGCTRAVGRPIPGVNAFSAPVFDHDGEPAVVITLLGHQDHMPSAWSSGMAAALKRAAGNLSMQLGHRPART